MHQENFCKERATGDLLSVAIYGEKTTVQTNYDRTPLFRIANRFPAHSHKLEAVRISTIGWLRKSGSFGLKAALSGDLELFDLPVEGGKTHAEYLRRLLFVLVVFGKHLLDELTFKILDGILERLGTAREKSSIRP